MKTDDFKGPNKLLQGLIQKAEGVSEASDIRFGPNVRVGVVAPIVVERSLKGAPIIRQGILYINTAEPSGITRISCTVYPEMTDGTIVIVPSGEIALEEKINSPG